MAADKEGTGPREGEGGLLLLLASFWSPREPPPFSYALLTLLVFLGALVLHAFFSRKNSRCGCEGFEQSQVFVLKRNRDVFDKFYGEIYDILHKPEITTPFIVDAVIRMTQMNSSISSSSSTCVLDLCCGTAHVTNAFAKRGFLVYGVDVSPSMVELAGQRYPRLQPYLHVGDVEAPMTFEKNVFSHILCLNKSIYFFENKKAALLNVFHWLQPNGYFVLHLVNPSEFDRIVPAGRQNVLYDDEADGDDAKSTPPRRIRSTEIDFLDFEYKATWKGESSSSRGGGGGGGGGACAGVVEVFTEMFRDSSSGKVRQNEVTLFMNSVDDLLRLCLQCGFMLRGKTNILKNPHEYLIVLERPNFF